jgi:predicted metalloprotease with PDZ domain
VDSPLIAGEYFKAVDITPEGEPVHHEIDIAADSEAALDISPEVRQKFVNLVSETGKIFGTRHYREYHFLLSLSDRVAHFGVEHHESNDSRAGERGLIESRQSGRVGSLLSHEFVHSWSGKFRRPKSLSTPYYQEPEETDLLWSYEGLTTYLGNLLAERSGFSTPEQYREEIATTAAEMGPGRPGRTWRPLQDTADGEQIISRGGGWGNWRRGTDYYPEGDLLWFEVDTIIRRESHGTKTLTDFLHDFFGGPNNGPELKPYTFDELVTALGRVAQYDWRGFFNERLTSTSPDAPVGGIENSGWKLVYDDKPPQGGPGGGGAAGTNATYSLGLQLGNDGTVRDSMVGAPAYKAGITSGMKIVAVNGRAFTGPVFADALKGTATSSAPIEFLVLNDDYYKTVSVSYQGGPKYPHLERDSSKPDVLADIMKPLAH